MQPDFIAFFQERIATAYQEQTWAVVLVGGMNAFIANHAERILKGLNYWIVQTAVATISLFALGFVWSRHLIFMHYDDCLKENLVSNAAGFICSQFHVSQIQLFLARWSGIALYSLIILGLYIVASRIIAGSKPEKGAEPPL